MNERLKLGRKIRAEVLGEDTVRRRLDEADVFNKDFQELITEFCWGAGWGRSALSRRDRSLMNLGMLSALNRPDEFALHVRAAIGNGVTRDELQDALIQVLDVESILAEIAQTRMDASLAPEMAQEDTAFLPSLLVVPEGTTVRFPNHDPFFHNVFSYSGAGRFDLGRYPRGESKDVTFEEAGLLKVYCEVHESMRAAILVVENPFWAQPDAEGRFRMEGVPVGEHTLVVWHADRGEREVTVRVPEAGVARVEVEL